jgi:hypothetical protein
MTTNEIKAFFALRGLSLSAVALSIGEDRSAVSRVVNYERPGPRIRKKLKRKYRGLKFEEEAAHQQRAA